MSAKGIIMEIIKGWKFISPCKENKNFYVMININGRLKFVPFYLTSNFIFDIYKNRG